MRVLRTLLLVVVSAVLAACGGAPSRDGAPPDDRRWEDVPDAVPRVEPRSRYGNPRSYTVNGQRYHVLESGRGYVERGIASWYGTKFHGRRTSSGEPYDMYAMTAAHKTLPLPAYVEVTNLENGRRVVLRVNDRGPFHGNRIIDLSYTAARKLDIYRTGTGYVEVRVLDPEAPARLATTPPAAARAAATGAGGLSLSLQVGAFAVRDNADRLAARMRGLVGDRVGITSATVAGQALWRVRIGPLAGVEEVDRLSASVEQLGLETPQVIIE
ncbi:MAG: septal ring lytic transglycosylase RlpA family protein [Chromatiales bacterium]|nr:septal ring lytic transglycosylase RlpA family protein [Chromatiales bacterium]